ncbi:MAG: AMP-binding protein, partial [Verrucomicrobiales bacterium]
MSQSLLTDRFWEARENDVQLPDHAANSSPEIEHALRTANVDGAVSFYSSGTTGDARCVIHSRAGLLASARAVNAHLDARTEDVWLCALPVFHVGGFGVYARAYCSGSMVCG